MKAVINSLQRKIRSFVNRIRRLSLTRWGLIVAIVTGIITLAAWLIPEPLKTTFNPIFQPTTIAQGLGITEPIPQRNLAKVRILVAEFDDPSKSNYRVTDLILANLNSALTNYSGAEVIALRRVITEKDGSVLADEIGKIYEANIVIWGWYDLTDTAVPLGIHFQIIKTPVIVHPNSCQAVSVKSITQTRKADLTALNELTLQTNLSSELSYATLFTLGVIRYDAGDYEDAIVLLDDAFQHLTEQTILSAETQGSGIIIDQDLLYAFRGKAHLKLGNYSVALDNFYNISNANLGVDLDIAAALTGMERSDEALDIYGKVIKNGSQDLLSAAFYQRGLLYEQLGMLELANEDFLIAIRQNQEAIPEFSAPPTSSMAEIDILTTYISQNPSNPFYYYWRGIGFQKNKQNENALLDFDSAIKLAPDFYVAREARSHILVETSKFQAAIDDLDHIVQAQDFRTPCNLVNRGVSYAKTHNLGLAKQDFLDAVFLSTTVINEDPSNAFAYQVRYLAYKNLAKTPFWQLISPFELYDIYALKDLLSLRQLNVDCEKGTCLELAILSGVVDIVFPYLLWSYIVLTVVVRKKEILLLYKKVMRQKK